MSRVHELLTNKVLRTEHRAFVLCFLLTIAAHVGTTLWLNSIRQTAALWFVWVLIVVQLFFFLTIFVMCSLRLKQCGFRHRWLLFIPLFLSRVENWQIVVIPVLALCMIILSARNRNVAPENQNLLAAAFSEPSSDPSEQAQPGDANREPASFHFMSVCHPRFGCVARFTGLAVADLVSR